ncbi:cytochrome P450 [Streptomyces carminius]|uniref:cytochrome P450 n=1 Tax=Streptomyces carminius TaxID=2665496 RepID=UPI001E3E37BC|nr:cytochrome P450 [Streptomyces carminius]
MTTPSPGPDTAPPPGCPAHSAPGGTPGSGSGLPALYGPGFAADPDALYARLRPQGPAHWVELAPGVPAVVVTDYAAALEVLRSSQFSKDARRWTALMEGRIPMDNEVVPMMGFRPSLLFADGDRHLRLRKTVDDALARVDSYRVRSYVRRGAGRLIGEFGPMGRAELVSQYSHRIPPLVFTQLFGCSDEQTERMARACAQMIAAEPATAQRGSEDLARCLAGLIADKRRSPGADLTSWLLHHPLRLSDEEMLHQLVVLIGAGTVPQSAWISSAIMLLLTDDRFAGDLSGGSLTVSDALNEVLWKRSPMANFCFHYATNEYDLRDDSGAGLLIPPGVPVLISHEAVNSHAVRGTAGDRRSNHAHLAFGGGPHVCPAQGLSEIIADVAIETLLDVLPDMELAVPAGDLVWRPGPFHRSLAALPVIFPALSASEPVPESVPEPGPASTPVQTSAASEQTSGGQSWNHSTSPSSIPPAVTVPERRPDSVPGGRRRRWSSPVAWLRGR